MKLDRYELRSYLTGGNERWDKNDEKIQGKWYTLQMGADMMKEETLITRGKG